MTDVFSLDGLVDVNGQPVPLGHFIPGPDRPGGAPARPGLSAPSSRASGERRRGRRAAVRAESPSPGAEQEGAAAGAGSSLAALVDTVQEQGGDEVLQGCLPSEEPGCVDGLSSALPRGKAGDPFGRDCVDCGDAEPCLAPFGSIPVSS